MPEQPAVIVNKGTVYSNNRRTSDGSKGGLENVIVISQDLYVALYDYTAGTHEELNFKAGDQLQILDSTHKSWWLARALNPRGKAEGYIPANYVALVASIESKP